MRTTERRNGIESALAGGVRTIDPFAREGLPVLEERAFDPSDRMGSGQLVQKMLNLGGAERVTRPYLESSWVHICLDLISDFASSVPLRLRAGEDPDAPVIESHPLLDLLRKPSSLLTGRRLVKSLILDWYHDGEQFWFCSDRAGQPFDLSRGLPDVITPVRGELVEEPREADIRRNGPLIEIAQWRTYSASQEVTYPAEAVAQIMRHNPYSPLRGLGLLTAIMRTVENDFQAQRFDDALLKSGGTPPYAYKTDQRLTEAQVNLMRERWREKNRHGEREGEPLFLGSGLDVKTLGLSPKDMEFMEMRRWYRDLIFSAFRIPLVLLGREQESGFSRAGQREARLAFHEDVIGPVLDKVEVELNCSFTSRMPGGDRLWLFFDDTELREDSLDILIDRTLRLTNEGRLEFNTAAELAGWNIPEVEQEPRAPMPFPSGEGDEAGGDGNDEGDEEAEESSERSHLAGPSSALVTREMPTRAEVWKQFDNALEVSDTATEKAVKRVFESFLDQVIEDVASFAAGEKQLSQDELDVLFRELEQWQDELSGEVGPVSARLFEDQSRELLRAAGLSFDVASALKATDEGPAAFLAQKDLKLRETLATLRDLVKGTIFNTITENGEISINDLSTAIRSKLEEVQEELEVMQDKLGTRARMIARTETTAIANGSRILTMQANGIELHEWLAEPDARDLHQIDGEIVEVGHPFSNQLRFPGDPNGTAENVINCRCGTLPVVDIDV